MAVTQNTIELKVIITALDPEEEFNIEDTMLAVASMVTEPEEHAGGFDEDDYVVVVGHQPKAEDMGDSDGLGKS